MNYTENNQINLENAVPMTKDDALKLNDNVFNFTISGKNQSSKDIYYGISIVYGEEQDTKTRLKDEDIDVYLTSGEDVLVNANRYKTLNDTRIWAEKINANTDTYTKDYSLRLWIDEGVKVGNDDTTSYSIEEWNNSYASFKVKVDGNLNEMNVPLEIESNQEYVENGKSYIIVKVSNYLNPHEAGIALASNDNMKVTITGSNPNIAFSYTDSEGNKETSEKDTLDLVYDFFSNKVVEIKLFVIPKNDANSSTDIDVKAVKNEKETFELIKHMNVKGNNYCLNNGFNKLSDCLLVSEQMSASTDDAKKAIISKGEATTSETAPTYTYVETEETPGVSIPQTPGYYWSFADSYTFDNKTGTFVLSGNLEQLVPLESKHIGKWTCGAIAQHSKCNTIYKITSIDSSTSAKGNKKTYKITSSLKSEVGLYRTVDNDGDTYYYRGAVENNNVKFGGFYWKIIRINGDGSIRLIYNGTKPNATGNDAIISNSVYNNRNEDPAYSGYMYGNDFYTEPHKSSLLDRFEVQNVNYYFSKSYTSNANNRNFSLGEDKIQSTVENLSSKLAEGYKYTCLSTTSNGNCNFLLEIASIVSYRIVKGYIWAFSSKSYEKTKEDNASVTVKTVVENWYKDNLANKNELNKSVSDYISLDATFCNDRSIASRADNGDGFSLHKTTFYSSFKRLSDNKTPTLVCNDVGDLFSAKGGTGKGNKKLDYPVGLIIVDELSFAGTYFVDPAPINGDFYLNSKVKYMTMTPWAFFAPSTNLYEWTLQENGGIGYNGSLTSLGVRPVINLNKEVLLAGGNGTMDNPYTVKLAN